MLPTLCRPLPCPSVASACRRSASSKAREEYQSPHDKKMEALVSLYHRSNTFITPENLSAVIDQAFTQPLDIGEDQKKHSVAELFRMKQSFRESPKFFLGRDDGSLSTHSSESMGPGWTESRSRRVDRVYRALMGTQKDGRPSWLALKENSERIQLQLDKDSQSSRQ